VNAKTGETKVTAFDFYDLAIKRNEVYGKELEHLWVSSGTRGISFLTAICCDYAVATSSEDTVQWEVQEFGDMEGLAKRMAEKVEEEPL
jgi:hypothetical protein